MALDVRMLDSSDYDEILVGWWKSWGFTPPSKDFLPNNGAGGCIVMDDNVPVCAGFLYTTNANVAWIDWIISSKDYRKKPERKEALSLLTKILTNMSKNLGNKYAYTLAKNRNLIDLYQEIGYVKTDLHNQEMIKIL